MLKVPRQSAAFGRKLLYAASRVWIDSFEPLKRAFDVAASAALLALTLPLSLAFVSYRKINGASVLTRAGRIGKLGRRYVQYDFADLEGRRIFRKLPFLFNILVGDASFIGPRPAAPGEPVIEANGRARLSVKPGLISPWWLRQRANIDFDDEASADREYLNTAGLAADLGIAVRAILALIFFEKRRAAAPRTVDILGIRIDNLNMADTLDWIRHRLSGDGHAVVSITNAHCANVSCLDAAYYQALLDSTLNLPDGVGLRIAGKLKRTPIQQNVNGTDLFPRLCAMLEGTGESLYLLGGRPGVAESVAGWIGKQYPNTSIVGHRHGYFQPHEEASVAEDIRRSGASVLLVAMGVPHQELWIHRNMSNTGVRVAIGVGGLFDFYSGRIPRAPDWMRELGLEWTYRLLQEPGRMWRRYLIGNWSFLARHLFYELKMYRPHRQATGV
jgi:N-acetylglucosaminyldiphosphoundecaprenol N-acetyl-beta-D-mannosaminyltransferase